MTALIAGNWKMNGLAEDARGLAEALKGLGAEAQPAADILVCPPFPYLGLVAQVLAGSRIALGAQDCHGAASGAHTGDTASDHNDIISAGDTDLIGFAEIFHFLHPPGSL